MPVLLPRPSGTPSKTEGEFPRAGTVCRGRKQCANESVDIANIKALAAKSFFLRYL